MSPDARPRDSDSPGQSDISRRTLLTAGSSALVGAGLGYGGAVWLPRRAPTLWPQPNVIDAPPVMGLHLQFGKDAATEVVVSWHSTDPVRQPRVLVGTPTAGFGRTVQAETRTYRDARSGTEVRVNHARLSGLAPDTEYIYAAVHDGTTPEGGAVRTAPVGRQPLRFTSFGDQSTPTLNSVTNGAYGNDHYGTPAAARTTLAVESMAPLFNLINGDLCYADVAHDRIGAWSDWFTANSLSARHRPWMPTAGNHENELGNGPIGFAAYQTFFALPDSGADQQLRGLWYSFTAGSVRVISLSNDDICLEDGGDTYVRGYSGGAQKRWLHKELADARQDPRVDWVVVCMHQTAISTSYQSNGADLGIRQEWLPLFDQYHVDLVLCGHEHHYERAHPIRGALPNDTMTPIPVSTKIDVIDTSQGTVHVVIGCGGTSKTSNTRFFAQPQCQVVTGVSEFDSARKRRPSIFVTEAAPWSAFRDRENPYGFVVFDVDPGPPGGYTSIKATHYGLKDPFGQLAVVDEFTLTRPRGDR
ncbi:MAG: metallophosphoesterase family protein [Mycobacteriaceae bacterium]|nr:metallophosphoesterase family protein [Mycobacteriaceae bacterium]